MLLNQLRKEAMRRLQVGKIDNWMESVSILLRLILKIVRQKENLVDSMIIIVVSHPDLNLGRASKWSDESK